MAEPFLTREKQVLRQVEDDKGTAETLTATDGGIRISADSSFEVNEPSNPRDIARSTLTSLGNLPGEKSGTITVRAEMNTPDAITTGDLEFKPELRGCGMTVLDTKAIGIATFTNGPFTRNETITDASGNTARLLVPAETGDANMYVAAISGSLQDAETLTGSASLATVTSQGTYCNAGFYSKPQSTNPDTITYQLQEDGYQWTIAGAQGNLTATMEANRAGIFEFVFNGVKSSYGDQSMTTGITLPTDQPAILQGAELLIDSQIVVFQSATLDLGNNVVPRIDGNKATFGIKHFYISARDAKLTITFEQILASTLDIFADLADGSKIPIAFHIGTAVQKTIWMFADLSQVTSISKGDSDGIVTLDLGFTLTGDPNSEDDEIEMVFI